MAGEQRSAQVERWLNLAMSVVAPVTVVSAVLFYFGYVSSRAQYDYFGVDVDTIGLSTQDYVMRSPQPLLVPVLVLTLLGTALLAGHTAVRRRLAAGARPLRHLRTAIVAGLALLAIGLMLLFGYALVADWILYPLVTPLVLAVGAAVTAYSLSTMRWLETREETGLQQDHTFVRPGVIGLLWVAVAAGVFWSTATLAEWSGRGLAQEQARDLDELPSVVVDTRDRLYLPTGTGIQERRLAPTADDTGFRYRYFDLRLLIHGNDRMFLVPERWSPTATTVVLPLNDDIRVQFQFRNLPPE